MYNWGERSILGGLRLNFTTVCWNHKQQSSTGRFNTIEFRAVGNDIAVKYLEPIADHIEKVFGQASQREATNESVTLEWIINDEKIYLYFFEQHDVKKLHFEISKL